MKKIEEIKLFIDGKHVNVESGEKYNNFGICECEKPCNGKGKNNTCKKITIAVIKNLAEI